MNTAPIRKFADHTHAATIGLLDGLEHGPDDYTPTHATEHAAPGTYVKASKAGKALRKHVEKARATAAAKKSHATPDATRPGDATVSSPVERPVS